jgi:hypothetical protein
MRTNESSCVCGAVGGSVGSCVGSCVGGCVGASVSLVVMNMPLLGAAVDVGALVSWCT